MNHADFLDALCAALHLDENADFDDIVERVKLTTSLLTRWQREITSALNLEKRSCLEDVLDAIRVRPTRRNCWTCAHDEVDNRDGAHLCRAVNPAVADWMQATESAGKMVRQDLMPEPDADGCPGYAGRE